MRPRLLLTINWKFAVAFFDRGLHTRTAVARLPLRQLLFLVYDAETKPSFESQASELQTYQRKTEFNAKWPFKVDPSAAEWRRRCQLKASGENGRRVAEPAEIISRRRRNFYGASRRRNNYSR